MEICANLWTKHCAWPSKRGALLPLEDTVDFDKRCGSVFKITKSQSISQEMFGEKWLPSKEKITIKEDRMNRIRLKTVLKDDKLYVFKGFSCTGAANDEFLLCFIVCVTTFVVVLVIIGS